MSDHRWVTGDGHAVDDEFNDDPLAGNWTWESWADVVVPIDWPAWSSAGDCLAVDRAVGRSAPGEQWMVTERNGQSFTLGLEASGISHAEFAECVALA